jgi:uncharacterized protein DUF4180
MGGQRAPVRTFNDVRDRLPPETSGICLAEEDFAPEFFDLRSGIAGEIFQKCVNYRVSLAIVLPDPAWHGARFAELAYEHRTHPTIRFFPSRDAAEAWLRAVG